MHEDAPAHSADGEVDRVGRRVPQRDVIVAQRFTVAPPSAVHVRDPSQRDDLLEVFMTVIPAPWQNIPGGVNKAQQAAYRDTGIIYVPKEAASCLPL